MADPDDLDLLRGVKAIARCLGVTPRQAEHMIRRRQVPTFRIGGFVCARRSSLASHIAAQEAAAAAVARDA